MFASLSGFAGPDMLHTVYGILDVAKGLIIF
jgi:hypothetical protein